MQIHQEIKLEKMHRSTVMILIDFESDIKKLCGPFFFATLILQ